jgi:YdjC-like protein
MTGGAPTVRAARRWVVCADDFALDRGTIEGTLALIKMGRVTATSVLVDSPNWIAAAPELKAVADKADVGLHLNLTEVLDLGDPIDAASRTALAPAQPDRPAAGLVRRSIRTAAGFHRRPPSRPPATGSA